MFLMSEKDGRVPSGILLAHLRDLLRVSRVAPRWRHTIVVQRDHKCFNLLDRWVQFFNNIVSRHFQRALGPVINCCELGV